MLYRMFVQEEKTNLERDKADAAKGRREYTGGLGVLLSVMCNGVYF